MLYFHHSNCLNQLTEILLQKLNNHQSSVLNTEQILVQNPGMKRWLQQQISLNSGIAANFEFPLPSRFIWDIFLSQFKDVESLSAYDGEVLRWRLMSIFKEHEQDKPLKLLQPYLNQDEKGLARFQLAGKLASLFDQYLVYRPEMIRRWEQGQQTLSSTESWQCYLWSLLQQQNDQPHRAELVGRLIKHLSSDQVEQEKLPERLFVFAISAMSPLYMNVLAALGQIIEVHVFNLNPCEHYWGDLQSKRDQIKRGEQPIMENELLASLGKQGRDYIDQFYDSPFESVDNHHFKEIKQSHLLSRIKYDILHLTQENLETEFQDDQSIQIVNCYSELRELQVLQDRLLQMFADDKMLQPHEIVVMCPDINTLAPYIEAVFGEQVEQHKIPFSISDHNILSSTPLLQAILDWIKLPTSRLTANEVLSWLELPALQRAYDLDEQSVETIRYWVKTNHIHWGMDRAFKQQLGLGENNLNTWIFGINRLLSAYTMNDDTELFEGQVASDCILNNAEYQALGQLQKLLDDVSQWKDQFQKPATLESWQQRINELIDNLLNLDDDEDWLLKPLRDEMANWQQQAAQSGFNETIEADLIHHMIENAIDQGSTSHRYLTGGINFCNLIPMRTLPFRVVCLIGMAEDRFPRLEIPLQLDLMNIKPQKGDRSSREDDRYMFLQSLLSAQDIFYISYVGQNKKDNSSIEASVVVTELIDHIEQTTGFRVPVVKTALQAFSAENYQQGSYSDLWYSPKQPEPLLAFDQKINHCAQEIKVSLVELISFYKNPARYFMEQSLNMSLYEYDESISDDEVFSLDPLSRYQLNAELRNDLLNQGKVTTDKYLKSGVLAEQNSGQLQLIEQKELAEESIQLLSSHSGFSGLFFYEKTETFDQFDISARISSYSNQGLLQSTESSLKGKQLFSYWIQHCFLCISEQIEFTEFFSKGNKCSGFNLLSSGNARDIVKQLIDGFVEGKQRLLPFYVDTAYEYEKAKIKKDDTQALQSIQTLWKGDDFNPFYEAEDIYLKTSLKNSVFSAEHFNQEFFKLSSRYMTPLLEMMEEKR